MKRNYIMKILYDFSFIFFLIKAYINRELESPEKILENLHRFLNSGFYSNEEIIINKKYHFNLNYIQPLLNYSKYYLRNHSINIIEPKLLLIFKTKLFIQFNSKINYYNEKNKPYNSLSIEILMQVNFSSIVFNRLEDNSYVMKHQFNNDAFNNNSKIAFNYINNYSFFSENQITEEEKKNFVDLYINRTNSYLQEYPECDGLFLFNKIIDYMLRTKTFNSTWSYSFYFEKPEILSFIYEKHMKIENIKSKFINIKIKISYGLCDENWYYNSCKTTIRFCTIKNILIDKSNITYGDFEIITGVCEYEDKFIIKEIIDKSKESIIHFL